MRQGPIRQWRDAGSYGAQLAKRQREQQKIYSKYSTVVEDMKESLPDETTRESELRREVEKAVANCEYASSEEAARGNTDEARRYEIKARMIQGLAPKSEIHEYFRLLEKSRKGSREKSGERGCGMRVFLFLLGIGLALAGWTAMQNDGPIWLVCIGLGGCVPAILGAFNLEYL